MFLFTSKLGQRNINLFLRTMSNCIPESVPAQNPLKRIPEDSEVDVPDKKLRVEYQRVKRRKYAVLICYLGTGYLGLQRNPGQKTIEEDLLVAMLKADVITQEAYTQPKVIEFQRAARTDKGVSAVRQTLSLKLPLEICLESINKYLPEQIRMVSVKRATKGFNCKGHCDARTYSYTMPSFAFAPHEEQLDEKYTISSERTEEINELLKSFLGTKNYHNFTSRRKALDPSAKRYIISFTCESPFAMDGVEFIVLKVKGQSFMLHQIRKMIGLVIAIMRGLTSSDTITKAWGEEKLDLPIAPGVGLVLEEVHYDRYNDRYSSDGIHDPIEWSACKEELEEFKKKHILPNIVKTEKEEKSMMLWLENLPKHKFDVRDIHRQMEEGGVEIEENGVDEEKTDTSLKS